MFDERQIVRRQSARSLSTALSVQPNLQWLWFGLFVLGLTFLGGSSRPDPIQNALLRPISALLLVPAIWNLRPADLDRGRAILLMLALLVVWVVLQLVPLPAPVWQALPGREIVTALDAVAGLENVWRPISLTPFRGAESAFAMLVPFTALLLALGMRMRFRALLFAIVGIGVIDAAFGLLQVIGGAESPLYLFAFSSRGAPAGIFANENHSAVYSAIVLLIITRLALQSQMQEDPTWIRFSYVPAFVLVLLAVLVTGSRAGFVATIAALISSAIMVSFATAGANTSPARGRGRLDLLSSRSLALGSCGVAVALVGLAFVWLERTPAVSDIMGRTSFEDLRWSLLPILGEMASRHWIAGTGFGSFDAVYRMYEPTDLLIPAYVNHAHNDWLQFMIEGGLPAICLLVTFLTWFIWSVASLRNAGGARGEKIIFWTACLVILAAAELVDYPLRTPVFQATAMWLLLCLTADRARAEAR